MNQWFPKPRMKLSGDPILGPNPLNRTRLLPSNVNPLTTVELDTRSGCRQGVVMWRSCLLQTVLKLTSAGEHRTETLRRTQSELTSRTDLMKPEGISRHAFSTWWCLDNGLAQVDLRDSSLDGSTGREVEWTQLNFIIPF